MLITHITRRSATAPPPEDEESFDFLPAELLDYLFDLVDSPSTLYASSLVCRRWRHPAQRALFQNAPELFSVSRRDAERWLESPARERYHIKRLRLYAPDEVPVRRVLSACEGLQTLSLQALGTKNSFRCLSTPSLSGALSAPCKPLCKFIAVI